MNTDKEGLAPARVLALAVSSPKRFLIRVYLCSSVVNQLYALLLG
jgi:hypothetical protein